MKIVVLDGRVVERARPAAVLVTNKARVSARAIEQAPELRLIAVSADCLLTPHIAWATREARRRLLEATVANVASFRAGQPTNVVT